MSTAVAKPLVGHLQEPTLKAVGTDLDVSQHFNRWPNESGFNAQVEHHEPIPLKVKGSFPLYVAGTLMRTGPGAFKFPRKNARDGCVSASHWFDGFSHVHKFEIQPTSEGSTRVQYSSRMQADTALEYARETGNLQGISFGQKRDPCDSFFKKLKSVWEPSREPFQNIGVAFQKTTQPELSGNDQAKEHRQALTATTDQSRTLQFDLDTLEPFGVTKQTTLHRELDGELSAAHASIDPDNGDIFNYNLKFGPQPIYRMFRVNAKSGTTDILATIKGLEPMYIHSQLLTEHFHILCAWPAKFAMGGAKVLWERNLLSAMEKFDTKASTTWIVVDRRFGQGVVAKFTSPAIFSFHTVNAWDEVESDGKVDVHCELVQYPNMDILHHFYYDHLVSNGPKAEKLKPTSGLALTRYRLPGVVLPTASITAASKLKVNLSKIPSRSAEQEWRIEGEKAGDLPTFNPSYSLKPHRFVYGTADRGLSTFVDSLVKTDVQAKQSLLWSERGHTPGEPIFVADPECSAEDDGVLLSVVLDGLRGISYLLCLDARSMTEVARAEVPCAVGMGFHGCHLPEQRRD